MPELKPQDCTTKAKARVEWCKKNGFAGKLCSYAAVLGRLAHCSSGAEVCICMPSRLLVRVTRHPVAV